MSTLKTTPLAVAGVVSFILAGCTGGGASAPAQQEPQIDLAAEEQAVRQINAEWLELYRAKDAEGIGALFVEGGWTLNAEGGLSDGQAAIVATTRAGLEKSPDARDDWGAKQIWVAASGDLAVERGWWTTDEDGPGDKEEIKGEYVTVFTKVDGQWKVLADAGAPLGGTGGQD